MPISPMSLRNHIDRLQRSRVVAHVRESGRRTVEQVAAVPELEVEERRRIGLPHGHRPVRRQRAELSDDVARRPVHDLCELRDEDLVDAVSDMGGVPQINLWVLTKTAKW